MSKILDYIRKNKYCLLLLYWPVHFVWYELMRISHSKMEVLNLHCSLDDLIPFCEWFIFPYLCWYVYIASMLFYTLYKSKREFIRTDLLLTGCMLLPMIFCSLVPNGIEIAMQPDFETLGRDNFAIDLVKKIYAADSPPRCVMPSMHTSVSWALLFAVVQSESLKKKRYHQVCGVIMSVLITLSTVFIKQHSILDVFAGIGVAVVVYAIVKICEINYDKKRLKAL